MLTLAASLCCLIGGAILYLSHPNQRARARPLSPALGGLGGLACLLGLALWMLEHGVLVGLTIALTLWMTVFALLPYVATWQGAPPPSRTTRRHTEPRGDN